MLKLYDPELNDGKFAMVPFKVREKKFYLLFYREFTASFTYRFSWAVAEFTGRGFLLIYSSYLGKYTNLDKLKINVDYYSHSDFNHRTELQFGLDQKRNYILEDPFRYNHHIQILNNFEYLVLKKHIKNNIEKKH